MAFLFAVRYEIPIKSKCKDWRLYKDEDISSLVGGLLPFPDVLVTYVRTLGLHNFLHGTEFRVTEFDSLIRYVAETDWAETPGLFWNNYESDNIAVMLFHPAQRDKGKAYFMQVVLLGGRRSLLEPVTVFDYFPRGTSFLDECLHPPHAVTDSIPFLPRTTGRRIRPRSQLLGTDFAGGLDRGERRNSHRR